MNPDPDLAATLEGAPLWRIIYHHQEANDDSQTGPASVDWAETVAWFYTSAEAAWADAMTLLPPAGDPQPHAITVELGTFEPAPEGGHRWQTAGCAESVNLDSIAGDSVHESDLGDTENPPGPTPATHAAALTGAGQQPLF